MINGSATNSLPSVQENEFLPPISRWTTFGGLFILFVLSLAIPVAAVVKYKVTVKGQAVVRPAGELRIVQAAIEGQVKQIWVKENQVVKKGDAIATIDDSRLQAKKSQLQSSIQQTRLQLVQIVQEELPTAQAKLKSAQANLKATEAALLAARSKRDRYKSIAKVGALSRDQLEEAQLAFKQQEQAVEAQKAEVVAQQKNIVRLQQGVLAATTGKQNAIAFANQASSDKEYQALIKEQIEIQKQLERDKSELKQVTIDLQQTTITATADGIISQLNLRNPGQTLRAGEEVVQIVPSHVPLVIKAAVGSEEKGKVKVGQNVQMRVTACPYPDYGTLRGQVKAIAPDAVSSAKNDANAQINSSPKATAVGAFYEVTIEPETLALGHTTKKCQIQLGMDGRADIITREETVLQFLLRKARLITDL